MKTKKVILFIVEGITDKISLGGIIDKLVSSNLAKFHISEGDITSNNSTNTTNALRKVNDQVNKFINMQLGIKKSDIMRIVHLIDMDGAFVGKEQVSEKDVGKFIYNESEILAYSKDKVIERNIKKQKIINRLSLCPKIANIPYSMYYFSCNLEHVLHNKINVDDNEKMDYADNFADKFYKKEASFLEFIRNDKFAVKGEYKETWEFIKVNGNSLKRFSNFHLYFEE